MFRDVVTTRLGSEPSTPLVTCYGSDAPGDRSEFSARSFMNWVDKTANLVVDEFDLAEGDRIALPVLVEHPHHWMAWVWLAAAWRVGCLPDVGDRPGDLDQLDVALERADLVVGGPAVAAASVPTLACSLHPWGMPVDAVADGVLDFAAEVRPQPDAWLGPDPAADTPVWHTATWDEVAGAPWHERHLVAIDSPDAAVAALIAALPQASVVAVPASFTEAACHAIARAEKAIA